jgi:N-methylhydantoinase A
MELGGRLGVEIGGTFTDLVWQRPDGTLGTAKVPSTPAAVQQAVLHGLSAAGVDLASTAQLLHGSTVATNALLTRAGTTAGLITTAGFRDVIEIGTHARTGNIYDILYRKPASPIRRGLVAEVPERMGADGRPIAPLDAAAARVAIRRLLAAGVRSIGICLLHAYANPAHELALAALVRDEAPEVAFSLSHQVSPEFREFERSMTTAVSAFVGPVVGRYVRRMEEQLRARDYRGVLQIMQSNGGVMPAAAAEAGAVRMMLSGPAAGVRGGLWFAARNGIWDAITLDMGGTSTDVAIAPNLAPRMVQELEVDGLPIRMPAIDMVTVGAGGGSIGQVDAGGFLAVGPRSAGVQPGPACYGRGGTEPTVTDAQVVAGLLRPGRFFGGRMALDARAAEAALDRLGLPGGAGAAADAVLRMVNANMAQAVRLVSTARGIDPRDYTLVAFGGGGPLHGAQVAEQIGMRRVLVPWAPGLASAFGLLVADTVLDWAATRLQPLTEESFGPAVLAWLREEAVRLADAAGLAADGWRAEIGLDLRYAGQAFEFAVWLGEAPLPAAEVRARFEALHRERYGYTRASLPVEAVTYRVRVVRPAPPIVAPPAPVGRGTAPPAEEGPVTLGGRACTARFLARETLPGGLALRGPAVVEEASATTLVPPGWSLTVLPTGDVLLERDA